MMFLAGKVAPPPRHRIFAFYLPLVRGAKLNLLQGRGHGQKAFTAKTDPEIA